MAYRQPEHRPRKVGCIEKVVVALSGPTLPITEEIDALVNSWDHEAYVISTSTSGIGNYLQHYLDPKWGVLTLGLGLQPGRKSSQWIDDLYRRVVDSAVGASFGCRIPMECHYWRPDDFVMTTVLALKDEGAKLISH